MSTEQSEPGRLLARRYRLTEPIGEGGMGRVWQGADELLDRPVAIKELSIPPHLPQHEIDVLRTRMLREAHSAAQLSHPSIITVYDVVETDDRPWIVMELVRGPSLGDILKRDGTMAPERAATIGLQVAAALAVAHDRGIVHRDIKPGNVLIAGKRAVLTDFGIARVEGTTNLTRTGLLVGSPGYLAPEQAHGRKATPATDMWSLGVTLYQAVQGVTPFGRDTPVATLTAIVTEDVPPPDAAGPLRPLLERLLDKEPGNRPTVHEAARMLHEVSAAAAPAGKKKPAKAKKEKKERKERAAAPAPPPGPGPEAGAAAAPPAPPQPPAGAAPAGAPAQGRSGGQGRSIAPVVIAVVLALALAVGVGFWLGANGGTEAEPTGSEVAGDPGAGQAGASPSPSAEEEAADAGSGDGEEDAEDDAPATARYEDETGFALDLPDGWELDRREGTSVFFDVPGGGYLQIDQTDQPAGNAKDDWERQEGAISGNFAGYDLEGIDELDEDYLDRYISAADWEFTYDGSDGRMHAVNRAFHTEEKGYALFLVSPEAEWDRNRALLDPMTESFEPAS
ncbi:serine/threonine-protein kinase [Nocardiopsis sediminis]|uniref:non-specific serine/threonine protein kinase n=1 Tax=Nocardiopsis sediminis TaxID=1778267 RepID=A0ABV8FSW9_9ACTN